MAAILYQKWQPSCWTLYLRSNFIVLLLNIYLKFSVTCSCNLAKSCWDSNSNFCSISFVQHVKPCGHVRKCSPEMIWKINVIDIFQKGCFDILWQFMRSIGFLSCRFWSGMSGITWKNPHIRTVSNSCLDNGRYQGVIFCGHQGQWGRAPQAWQTLAWHYVTALITDIHRYWAVEGLLPFSGSISRGFHHKWDRKWALLGQYGISTFQAYHHDQQVSNCHRRNWADDKKCLPMT
jgi:hypothetical protein